MSDYNETIKTTYKSIDPEQKMTMTFEFYDD